jgi:hypothetical protein
MLALLNDEMLAPNRSQSQQRPTGKSFKIKRCYES